MSMGNGTTPVKITDDDETVDHSLKNQILQLRRTIDQDERELYVNRVRAHPEYSRREANEDWGLSVRQYLRGIKRLWDDEEEVNLPKIDYYWKEVELSPKETLYPPDTNGYQFSRVQRREQFANDRQLREAMGVGPRGDIPEPRTVSMQGLRSILNQNRIQESWAITTNKQGPPTEHNTEIVTISSPIPKHILENAVEAADNFLQGAGLGFDIEMPAYTGGEEPGI